MTLDYTLAKQLYKTGFPQGGNGSWLSDPDSIVVRAGERVYLPTLSELIEACGDFEALKKEHSHAGDEWIASSFHTRKHGRGSAPDVAVARLWLALSKTV